MPFKFKLAALLKVKQEEEKRCLTVLGKLRQYENRLRENVRHIEAQRNVWCSQYSKAAKQLEDASDLLLINDYLGALDRQQIHEENRIQELQADIKKSMEEVMLAKKAVKQIEYLKDRKKEEYQKELQAKIQRDADDLTAIRFLHEKSQEVA